ncbi:MAG: hypothetical protein LAQ69_41190 [Acidobacteriia bacterium]|nr:hypothetical protein [Terriglobia bacterium]
MRSLRLYFVAAVLPILLCGQQQAKQPPAKKPSTTPQQSQRSSEYWLSIFPIGTRIFGIQADVQNPEVLYASTHRGLYASSNGGMTWLQSWFVNATNLMMTQSENSPNVMYLSVGDNYKGALLKTSDRGRGWQQIGAQDIQRTVRSVQVSPDNADVLFVRSDSENGGFNRNSCRAVGRAGRIRFWSAWRADPIQLRSSLRLVELEHE